jgi:hypothetical protein
MSVLQEQEIKEILLTNPNKKLIADATAKSKQYRMHMYGTSMESYLATIQGFEEQPMRDLRVKYSRSNKDLFSRLGRPIDKVFSAHGGSTYYYLPDSQNKMALAIAGNVRSGFSLTRWMESYWRPHFLDDPNGCIFLEVGDGNYFPMGKGYPTYKSITSIYDYSPVGSMLDYISFHVDEATKKAAGIDPKKKVYRLVDDAFDYYVEVKGKQIIFLDDHVFPNYYMVVPAILNSDIIDPNHDGLRLSLYDDIVELADEYLLKGSIRITHDFLHAFPKYWEYADDCDKCGGTGSVNAKDCPDCKGKGKSLMTKVSRPKLLNWPETKDDPQVAPNVAGYVEPSEVYYNISTSDLSLLDDTMNFTVWGANSRKRTTGVSTNSNGEQEKTATEIIENLQPQNDRLHPISECAESRMKFIMDSIIRLEIKPDYKGASINLGRRYLTENPDTIWKRYVDAKSSGASVSLLDELYQEYIENKYSGDPVSMEIMLKLMRVEPFVHMTISEMKALVLPEQDYLAKLYYSEWYNTVEDGLVLGSSVEELRKSLYEYISDKELPKPEDEQGKGKKKPEVV